MNYGPLEFARYLGSHEKSAASSAVRRTRAVQPIAGEPVNLLKVISGPRAVAPDAMPTAAVCVFEAVAIGPGGDLATGAVRVLMRKPVGD